MRFKPPKVILKAGVSGLTQATRQTAVYHRMLAFMEIDASALVDQRLDPREIGIGPDKLTPLGKGPIAPRSSCGPRGIATFGAFGGICVGIAKHE